MLSVKGIFEQGVIRPVEPVTGREGQMVIITFLDEALTGSDAIEAENAWTALFQLVEQCAVETGLSDLAHQHDHYLHGQPKQEE